MEVSVLNINGQETGRKVTLNEAIFGVEPNDHVIYLDVKQYMANQRQGNAKSKERSEISGSTRKLGRQKGGGGATLSQRSVARSLDLHANWVVRRAAAVLVMVISTLLCCVVVVACSVLHLVTMASS